MMARYLALAILATAVLVDRAAAYVEVPYTLGRVTLEAAHVISMRVEKVDKQRNVIVYRKVADLKGTYPQDTIKHNIGQGGFSPREWQTIMAWAEVGKTAIFFHNNSSSETCIDNYWYQANAGGEWWQLTHAEPYMLRSFAGRPDKLAPLVAAMVAGQEVIVPCMVDGDKNALQLRTAKVQRMRASLKLQDYDPKRDFVGWGGEDFRRLAGMPRFTHLGGIGRVDPGVRGIAAADCNGDGKPELCLLGTGRAAVLQHEESVFSEVTLPLSVAARGGGWADLDGDKQPELLLLAPTGPKLLALADGKFVDRSDRLPAAAYHSIKAGAWINFDGDDRPDVLLADRFRGLSLWRNVSAQAKEGEPQLVDVSTEVGLGERGLGAGAVGEELTVADFNGDGRDDFFYGAGQGFLALSTPRGFVVGKESGIAWQPGSGTPVAADFDGDEHLDLFLPAGSNSRLYRNAGKGRFVDATAAAGLEAKRLNGARCALWTDVNGDGKLDLLVGCLKTSNRYYENTGKGTFTDKTIDFGFNQHVFNTGAMALLDLNRDGAADLVMNNEGQESVILLGRTAEAAPDRTAQE